MTDTPKIDIAKIEQDILFPESLEIEIQGKEYKIEPFKLGQIIEASKLISGIAEILLTINPKKVDSKVITEMLSKGGDSVLKFLSFAFKEKKEWAENLNLDDAIRAIAIVIQVNYDFFDRNVAPVLDQVLPEGTAEQVLQK